MEQLPSGDCGIPTGAVARHPRSLVTVVTVMAGLVFLASRRAGANAYVEAVHDPVDAAPPPLGARA